MEGEVVSGSFFAFGHPGGLSFDRWCLNIYLISAIGWGDWVLLATLLLLLGHLFFHLLLHLLVLCNLLLPLLLLQLLLRLLLNKAFFLPLPFLLNFVLFLPIPLFLFLAVGEGLFVDIDQVSHLLDGNVLLVDLGSEENHRADEPAGVPPFCQ